MEVQTSAQSSSQKEILSILAKDYLKIQIELFPQRAISHEN